MPWGGEIQKLPILAFKGFVRLLEAFRIELLFFRRNLIATNAKEITIGGYCKAHGVKRKESENEKINCGHGGNPCGIGC